jgi:ABC-type branched-subunit amino acid transport system substrate-binding protein
MLRIFSFSTALATGLCVSGLVWGAPLVSSSAIATAVQPAPLGINDAVAALRKFQWQKAADIYTPLVNTSNPFDRAQARYGLALAYSQLGREKDALKVLEGTLRDETTLGRAVGNLRARLVLQQADEAYATGGAQALGPWLDRYGRLPDQPDTDRYERLFSSQKASLAGGGVVNVGVLVPQTGPLKDVGLGILRGLQLGVKDFDGRRGVRVNLIVENATDATDAAEAARKLKEAGVDVVIGPLLGYTVQSVRDVMRPAGIPVLALTSDRTAVGDGVFALNYLPADQARAIAQQAISTGLTRFAVLTAETPYGKEAQSAFADEVAHLGGTMVKQARYDAKKVDVGSNVKALMTGVEKGSAPNFDALFVPAPGSKLPLLASQLSYYDIDKPKEDGSKVRLLGTSLWQDPAVTATSALRGSLFVVPPRVTDFGQRFADTFHVEQNPLSILGYDSVRIVLDVAAEKTRTGRDFATLLMRPEGFYGTGGYFRFHASGVTERGFSLVKVGSQFEVVQNGLTMPPLTKPE